MKPSVPRPGRLQIHPLSLAITSLLLVAVIVAGLRYRSLQKKLPPAATTEPSSEVVSAVPSPLPAPVMPQEIPPPDSQDLLLTSKEWGVPGSSATEWLYYGSVAAQSVQISGAWDGWEEKFPLQQVSPGVWAFYIPQLAVAMGSYQFKMLIDEEWQEGPNRLLYINEQGLMEKPPQVIAQALIDHPFQLRIQLYAPPENPDAVEVQAQPDLGIRRMRWRIPENQSTLSGYRIIGTEIQFVFDPTVYGISSDDLHSVQVAGNFNGWNPHDEKSRLHRQADGSWVVNQAYAPIYSKISRGEILYKFVVNGEWKMPPAHAPNAMLEPGTPHLNLRLPRPGEIYPELHIQTEDPIDLSAPPLLTLAGLYEKPLKVVPSPGGVFDSMYSPETPGVTLDKENEQTVFRIFAPRATSVTLGFFEGPYWQDEDEKRFPPTQTFPMEKDENGMWSHQQSGLLTGKYYAYQIDGPVGNGEGFNPRAWVGDPYATAVSLAEGNSIVMDFEAQTVQPQPRQRVAPEDMVIYETHVRHFTWDPSSGVAENLRGKYPGFLSTQGLGTGLDHLKELGVNVIQFMPIHEFNNGFGDRHDWGYASCFFFAPESSYATKPLEGSQVQEFRELVNGLHEQGFAVFLDVVYNHIGAYNIYNLIDRKYYFRLNPDFTNIDYSGCGNDVASERLMVRRMIVDSVLFWVEEYGIDGFRFDLGELIDDRTLLDIEREIRRKHTHVVLHSEPWSFRGSHKDFLGPTSWGAWNDRFREPAKQFVRGDGASDLLRQAVRGSVENWTTHPLQSVNYMESHDDFALVDELSHDPDKDGRNLTPRDERIHQLSAALIFGSLGTPMITEGQAFLRSKQGIRNTFNQGDALNALRWDERERPHAKEVLEFYKRMIAFRLSDAGRALRVSSAPSLDYIRFVESGSSQGLGWIANANRERGNVQPVMILMNAGQESLRFEVPDLGSDWVMTLKTASASGTQEIVRGGGVEVAAQSAVIYVLQ